jgi:S-methylmethionine-dependent homocysteine/selenocysteine methylase
MVSITCPCVECRYNGRAHKCTAKAIKLTYRNLATINEGRVDMWVCNKYELSDEAKRIEKDFMCDIFDGI